jgi:hypothetical protein
LPAGCFGERELGAGVHHADVVLVLRVSRQNKYRSVQSQPKESIERDIGDIHCGSVTAEWQAAIEKRKRRT